MSGCFNSLSNSLIRSVANFPNWIVNGWCAVAGSSSSSSGRVRDRLTNCDKWRCHTVLLCVRAFADAGSPNKRVHDCYYCWRIRPVYITKSKLLMCTWEICPIPCYLQCAGSVAVLAISLFGFRHMFVDVYPPKRKSTFRLGVEQDYFLVKLNGSMVSKERKTNFF